MMVVMIVGGPEGCSIFEEKRESSADNPCQHNMNNNITLNWNHPLYPINIIALFKHKTTFFQLLMNNNNDVASCQLKPDAHPQLFTAWFIWSYSTVWYSQGHCSLSKRETILGRLLFYCLYYSSTLTSHSSISSGDSGHRKRHFDCCHHRHQCLCDVRGSSSHFQSFRFLGWDIGNIDQTVNWIITKR